MTNNSYQVLVIGVGSIGERHVRCFQKTGRHKSRSARSMPLRSRVAEEYRIDRCYANLDSALADHYDAAVVATPAHLHVPIALRLAEAAARFWLRSR